MPYIFLVMIATLLLLIWEETEIDRKSIKKRLNEIKKDTHSNDVIDPRD